MLLSDGSQIVTVRVSMTRNPNRNPILVGEDYSVDMSPAGMTLKALIPNVTTDATIGKVTFRW